MELYASAVTGELHTVLISNSVNHKNKCESGMAFMDPTVSYIWVLLKESPFSCCFVAYFIVCPCSYST